MITPVFGQRSILTYIGDRLQCHICGKAWDSLGAHVSKGHKMSADDYRQEFSLSRDVGLVSDRLHVRFRQVHGPRLKHPCKRKDDGKLYQSPCVVCGKPIMWRHKSGERTYRVCGDVCRQRVATAAVTGKSQERTLARVASSKRIGELLKARAAERNTRQCAYCGHSFVVAKRSIKTVTCSYYCRNKHFGYRPPWQKAMAHA